MFREMNPFRWIGRRPKDPGTDLSSVFRLKYQHFKELLDANTQLSRIITDMEQKLRGEQLFGMSYVRSQSARAVFCTLRMIKSLNGLSANRYAVLYETLETLNGYIKDHLEKKDETHVPDLVLPYTEITREMVDWVGGKNANLGEVLSRVRLPIPEGFAITTRAYELLLETNDLVDEINKIKMQMDPNDPESVNTVSEDIQRLIISARVPRELETAILEAYDRMVERVAQRTSGDFPREVSLRSSAIGEDSELSYAGQYLSVLNVPRSRLIRTYNYIVASLFTPRAIAYRFNMGIRDEDIAMSVACLQMVDSVCSGVMYSHHPFNLFQDNILISAVWGLGPYAVDGLIGPDSFTVAKDGHLTLLESSISDKPVQLVRNPEGGLVQMPVPADRRKAPCLTPEQVRALAEIAMKLEAHYGMPQDIEWAMDPDGRLLVLQTRPLHLETSIQAGKEFDLPELAGYFVFLEGGSIAYPGVGFGPAHHVRSEEDLAGFPEGAVLIASNSSPKFVVIMPKARAIVTDSGSITGHMASLAREFGVPTLLGTEVATSRIPHGAEVTVDAYHGRVYKGRVPELLELQRDREPRMKETPVYRTLESIAQWIVPLRLFDPRSSTFSPEHCRSLHDIMRYVHELSYKEMFQISDLVSERGQCGARLQAPIPLDLCVIDLGGGLATRKPNPRKVVVEEVVSLPFRSLLKGMLHEGVRYQRPRPVEFGGFLSVMSEQMLSSPHTEDRFGDRSYAIVSDRYLNFSSRVGYHYGILDAFCDEVITKNYITFSFKGGAADDVRRNRRARSIALILENIGFSVEVMGDRVDARYQKYDLPLTQEKLDLVGRLLLFTRQLDMLMHSEKTVQQIAQAFLEEDYQLERTFCA